MGKVLFVAAGLQNPQEGAPGRENTAIFYYWNSSLRKNLDKRASRQCLNFWTRDLSKFTGDNSRRGKPD